MIVDVFEVYGDGSIYLIFLTEQEAKDQTHVSPSTGIYSDKISLTYKEYYELLTRRYMSIKLDGEWR